MVINHLLKEANEGNPNCAKVVRIPTIKMTVNLYLSTVKTMDNKIKVLAKSTFPGRMRPA